MMNLTDKARTIVHFDCLLFVLGLAIAAILSGIFAYQYGPDAAENDEHRIFFVAFIVRFAIAGVFQLGSIVTLLEGVAGKNFKRCANYMIVNKVFVGVMLISGVVKLFMDPVSIFYEVAGLVYKLFCLRLVNAFAVELQTDSVFHP